MTATVQLDVVGNRPFITLSLALPGRRSREARFFIDTGGGGFLLTEPLARELGISWGATMHEQGTEFGHANEVPGVRVADFPLGLDPSRVFVTVGKENMLPSAAPGHADGMLPGHVLSQYHVVFDYPGSSFTIGASGAFEPKGVCLPMPVATRSGFPRTEFVVDGEPHGFLVDTGASFTMVSELRLKAWGDAHPDWERHEGAVGEAVTLGGQTLETMFIPSAVWGSFELTRIGVVSQREGTFERWMSSMMAAPIIGSLAGNALKRFRVELDYAGQTLYLCE